MCASLLPNFFMTVRVIVLVSFLCLGAVREGYGQRVYANTEQNSGKQELLLLTVSEVTNPTRSTNSNENTYSTLNVAIGALNLYSATQNLQFTGINAIKLKPNSPIMVKTMVNGSVLGLLDAVSLQRTNGGMNNTVGAPYTVTQLLDLLGIIGGTDEELLVVLPVPGVSETNDGVQLKVNSVLSLGLSARLYYAFYITPPELDSQEIILCDGQSGQAIISNFYMENGVPYTYRLYNQQIGGIEVAPSTNTNTFTIPANLPEGDYYLEARENDLYPSARTKITVSVQPQPPAPILNINPNSQY